MKEINEHKTERRLPTRLRVITSPPLSAPSGRQYTEREIAKLRTFVNDQHEARRRGHHATQEGNILNHAAFDEETSRRLEAFRVGGPHARRAWRDPNDGQDCSDGDRGGGGSYGRGRTGGRGGGRGEGAPSLLRRAARRVFNLALTAAVVGGAGYLCYYLLVE